MIPCLSWFLGLLFLDLGFQGRETLLPIPIARGYQEKRYAPGSGCVPHKVLQDRWQFLWQLLWHVSWHFSILVLQVLKEKDSFPQVQHNALLGSFLQWERKVCLRLGKKAGCSLRRVPQQKSEPVLRIWQSRAAHGQQCLLH